MENWTIEQSEDIYRVSRWGGTFFDIGENGNMHVLPVETDHSVRIDMRAVLDEIVQEGIQFPVVLRFHDILRSQVERLNRTFGEVIEEAKYDAPYRGVYPIKVNQMREVVDEITRAGASFHFGLEAGSKAELLSVLAYKTSSEALTICNGYKDEEFLRLALLGNKLRRNTVVVIEKFSEIKPLLDLANEMKVKPIIGLRTKMRVTGRGKWESSSGERAKFGLSISEILNAVELIEAEGYLDCISLLHFHIGSQLTDIRSVQDAIDEAARIYAKLYKLGVPLKYLDVGGGLGIDYDGTRSTSESSRNYSLQEYVESVVYGTKQVCDLEGAPHPTLVSESGRAITAHHSCVVTKVIGEIKNDTGLVPTAAVEDEHILVTNMRDLVENLHDLQNYQAAHNEAQKIKEDAEAGFKLGVIGLKELGRIETMYWTVMRRVEGNLDTHDSMAEESTSLTERLSSQYLCNFSVFQSAADSWAIDQVLPVVPISRLNEEPTKNCSLVDITCDSDGKIAQFIGDTVTNSTLPLHALNEEEPYYIGLFLTGAYQDVMGDMHNLFGRLNEVHVSCDDDDPNDFYIEEVVEGSSAAQVLKIMQYNPGAMADRVKDAIDQEIAAGTIKSRQGVKLTDFYENCLKGYTYLKTK
ncbi:biosynthetic arginine decarboxylase [Kordiimonas sp. SCSIO 12603]|uniref:biosynthetic arginine decarboxylase n=1 Tax=Kordiimonas sp. SCSIO 12603 TaxID=2829596 RepID=UPI002103E14C|nr:biosynthetic arginine decarboxylase [Kordiimonas sp. SCSIO 12603]UTW60314.1 biosynthetic arginine decarboxylase [Kordiimonas sp. SCSIO 12603]